MEEVSTYGDGSDEENHEKVRYKTLAYVYADTMQANQITETARLIINLLRHCPAQACRKSARQLYRRSRQDDAATCFLSVSVLCSHPATLWSYHEQHCECHCAV